MRRRAAIAAAAAAAIVAGLVVWLVARGDETAPQRPSGVRAYAAATDRGGRVFAAVERLEGHRWRTAIATANPAGGDLDPGFADLPVANPRGITVDAEDRILVAGDRVVDGRHRLAVARVTKDGQLDQSFGTGGVAAVSAGSADAVARAVVSLAGGGAVVVGDARDGDSHAVAIAYLGPSGRDPRVELVPGASAAGAALDRDGNLVVAGTGTRDGSAVLVRAGEGGRLQTTRARTDLTSTRWTAVAAAPDGGAVVVGSGRGAGARSLVAVQRFDAGGAPSSGSSALPAGAADAFGTAVAVARDGRVTVGGTGVQGDRPAAFVATLGSSAPPAAAGRGALVALLPGGGAVVNRWDGDGLRAALLRR
jgi:hypothetical protein